MTEPVFGYPRGTKGWEKLLPSSALNRQLFLGTDSEHLFDLYSLLEDVSTFSREGKSLNVEESALHHLEELSASTIELGLLRFLVKSSRARNVLEIGTFVGVSAIALASGLQSDGRLLSIEKYPEFAEIARRNIASQNLQHVISVITGDASELLDELISEWTFDFVFVDGNKENYPIFLESLLLRMPLGGIIAIDDALFFGDVLNVAARTPKGRGVKQVVERVKSLGSSWEILLLPLYNGLLLLRRES